MPIEIFPKTGSGLYRGCFPSESSLRNFFPYEIEGALASVIDSGGDAYIYIYSPDIGGWVPVASGGGGGGTTNHNALSNRDMNDQHPMSAITGLVTALASKVDVSVYNAAIANIATLLADKVDTTTYTTQINNILTDLAGKVSQTDFTTLQTTVTALSGTVTSQGTAITANASAITALGTRTTALENGRVQSVTSPALSGIVVNNTDPKNPVLSVDPLVVPTSTTLANYMLKSVTNSGKLLQSVWVSNESTASTIVLKFRYAKVDNSGYVDESYTVTGATSSTPGLMTADDKTALEMLITQMAAIINNAPARLPGKSFTFEDFSNIDYTQKILRQNELDLYAMNVLGTTTIPQSVAVHNLNGNHLFIYDTNQHIPTDSLYQGEMDTAAMNSLPTPLDGDWVYNTDTSTVWLFGSGMWADTTANIWRDGLWVDNGLDSVSEAAEDVFGVIRGNPDYTTIPMPNPAVLGIFTDTTAVQAYYGYPYPTGWQVGYVYDNSTTQTEWAYDGTDFSDSGNPFDTTPPTIPFQRLNSGKVNINSIKYPYVIGWTELEDRVRDIEAAIAGMGTIATESSLGLVLSAPATKTNTAPNPNYRGSYPNLTMLAMLGSSAQVGNFAYLNDVQTYWGLTALPGTVQSNWTDTGETRPSAMFPETVTYTLPNTGMVEVLSDGQMKVRGYEDLEQTVNDNLSYAEENKYGIVQGASQTRDELVPNHLWKGEFADHTIFENLNPGDPGYVDLTDDSNSGIFIMDAAEGYCYMYQITGGAWSAFNTYEAVNYDKEQLPLPQYSVWESTGNRVPNFGYVYIHPSNNHMFVGGMENADSLGAVQSVNTIQPDPVTKDVTVSAIVTAAEYLAMTSAERAGKILSISDAGAPIPQVNGVLYNLPQLGVETIAHYTCMGRTVYVLGLESGYLSVPASTNTTLQLPVPVTRNITLLETKGWITDTDNGTSYPAQGIIAPATVTYTFGQWRYDPSSKVLRGTFNNGGPTVFNYSATLWMYYMDTI